MIQRNRTQERKAKTKKKIFTTALELFLTKGYEETTVQEIVDKADVAKGTFFNHFPTKDSILLYLGEERVAVTEQMLAESLAKEQNAKGKLVSVLKVLCKLNEAQKEITALVVNETFKRLFSKEFNQEKENQMKLKLMLTEIVQAGQQQGEFKKDIVPSYIADILISIYFFTLFQWLDGGLTDGLTNEVLSKLEVIFEGLGDE